MSSEPFESEGVYGVAQGAMLYFQHLANGLFWEYGDGGDAMRLDAIDRELPSAVDRIHRLPITSIEAIQAKLALLYYKTKFAGPGNRDAMLALDDLADALILNFKDAIDLHLSSLSADHPWREGPQPNAM